ncbi:hypothetical protein RBY4I_3591 [Rhodobacterales bacterium Y4I]|nr:hypothetical protein RBY4I_3591 [Rhodobacterales bacterium Y4I]
MENRRGSVWGPDGRSPSQPKVQIKERRWQDVLCDVARSGTARA